jgi:hypothetical protein
MSTTFLLAAILGLLYVIYWMIQNDRAATIADQRGWFRMRLSLPRAAGLAKSEIRPRRSPPSEESGVPPRSAKRSSRRVPRGGEVGIPPVVDSGSLSASESETLQSPEIVHPLVDRSRRRRRFAP